MDPSPSATAVELVADGTEMKSLEERQKEKETEREIKEDIEHILVEDDPRLWSSRRKTAILAIIAFTAMSGTISTNIFFPALDSLKSDLNTTQTLISVSISLFILFQGVTPVLWSAFSEIKGRRMPYIVSLVIYCAATIGSGTVNSIAGFIVLRIIQAAGSSAVLSLGAGTLADIYDSHERGVKLGIYYLLPLLGPSVGPLIGGLFTASSSWRATFYFLEGYGVICLLLMLWLPETFRKERSSAWIAAMDSARAHAKAAKLLQADPPSPVTDSPLPRSVTPRATFLAPTPSQLERNASSSTVPVLPTLDKILSRLSLKTDDDAVKMKLADVNPFSAVGIVLSQKHNIVATLVSGLLFACQYSIAYTVAISFAAPPYNYSSIGVGLVLLSFGVGNLVGSVGGGKYSDVMLRRLKKANGGVGEPEMRIRSTKIAMYFVPTSLIVYAWTVDYQVNVAVPIIALFVLGLSTIWIYSSTLAFIVDSNKGRSSSAVACNSLARGSLACIASFIAEPLTRTITGKFFYTGFAVILTVALVFLTIVAERGKRWREEEEAAMRMRDKK